MDDDELSMWGAHGRSVELDIPTLDRRTVERDIVTIWNILGALIARVVDSKGEVEG